MNPFLTRVEKKHIQGSVLLSDRCFTRYQYDSRLQINQGWKLDILVKHLPLNFRRYHVYVSLSTSEFNQKKASETKGALIEVVFRSRFHDCQFYSKTLLDNKRRFKAETEKTSISKRPESTTLQWRRSLPHKINNRMCTFNIISEYPRSKKLSQKLIWVFLLIV